jgi:regulator of nucleoside diphosphate kinase
MADRIYITKSDFHDLHALIAQHAESRDEAAAERLAEELERALVVDPQQLPPDVVTMHSRVAFETVDTGTRREVVVVQPAAADASAGKVSVLAPVGAALIGLRTGDTIKWPLPGDRIVEIRILGVEQPPRGEEPGLIEPFGAAT